MTISFPLSTASFASAIKQTGVKWSLGVSAQTSGMDNGIINSSDLSPEYWTAEVSLITYDSRTAVRIQAMLESLNGALGTFYLYDPRATSPQYESRAEQIVSGIPNGWFLSSGAVGSGTWNDTVAWNLTVWFLFGGVIGPGEWIDSKPWLSGASFPETAPQFTSSLSAISIDGLTVSVTGLPGGYILTVGDMFSFDYASGAKRSLHRIASTVTASSGGVASDIDIVPPIPAGVTTGTVINLIAPSAKMRMIPDSINYGTGRQNFTSEISFKCRQVP